MSDHSVSSHLHLDTAEYDRIIRTYIPAYEESRAVQLDLLAEVAAASRPVRLADLGGGTGSLAEAILDRFPLATVLVRDIDPAMLDVARQRLARFGPRVTLERATFADPLPPVDAVVSAFALHHIPRLDQKVAAYQRVRQALAPGGLFLNNDATAGPFWPGIRDGWAAFMATRGFTLEQGYENLNNWAAEDTYFSVREELSALAEAGFVNADCLWRQGPTTILGARV